MTQKPITPIIEQLPPSGTPPPMIAKQEHINGGCPVCPVCSPKKTRVKKKCPPKKGCPPCPVCSPQKECPPCSKKKKRPRVLPPPKQHLYAKKFKEGIRKGRFEVGHNNKLYFFLGHPDLEQDPINLGILDPKSAVKLKNILTRVSKGDSKKRTSKRKTNQKKRLEKHKKTKKKISSK